MKINWNFFGGIRGYKTKNLLWGASMDIFWNCTLSVKVEKNKDVYVYFSDSCRFCGTLLQFLFAQRL